MNGMLKTNSKHKIIYFVSSTILFLSYCENRMYGALTGMSKLMVGQKHGQAQLKAWRRSYATRPPQVSSFSSDYPGNDDRYQRVIRLTHKNTHTTHTHIHICMYHIQSYNYVRTHTLYSVTKMT